MNNRDVNKEIQRFIQGDAGEMDSILGAGNIGHCDKHSSYEQVSESEWFPRYSCLNRQMCKHCGW